MKAFSRAEKACVHKMLSHQAECKKPFEVQTFEVWSYWYFFFNAGICATKIFILVNLSACPNVIFESSFGWEYQIFI